MLKPTSTHTRWKKSSDGDLKEETNKKLAKTGTIVSGIRQQQYPNGKIIQDPTFGEPKVSNKLLNIQSVETSDISPRASESKTTFQDLRSIPDKKRRFPSDGTNPRFEQDPPVGKVEPKQVLPSAVILNDNLNMPHPSLEYPPLYFVLKRLGLLDKVRGLYKIRWSLSYPLQKRVYGSRFLRKIGLFWTFGELLLFLPFVAVMVSCVIYSFVKPSVTVTGQAARVPLLFCFFTGMRNSFVTLLLGMPFERALWYHKLSGRIAFVSGMFHTYVHLMEKDPSKRDKSDLVQYFFNDSMQTGGTVLFLCILIMVCTSFPMIRRRMFECFFYIHVVFAAACLACAFYHTGILGPTIGALTWGGDLLIRKLYMAGVRYPRKANVKVLSNSVLQVSFQKTKSFDYNPGQYIRICVPDISLFEWHPFSLSSSPQEDQVTLHVRRAGTWTNALHGLAENMDQVSILFEGPYGSVGIDLMSDRYKMIMLISGGIGVTPVQSLCNQLVFEHATNQRSIKKLCLVWMERDPITLERMDVTYRGSSIHKSIRSFCVDGSNHDEQTTESKSECRVSTIGLASALLAFVPASRTTDAELVQQYPSHTLDVDSQHGSDSDDFKSCTLDDIHGFDSAYFESCSSFESSSADAEFEDVASNLERGNRKSDKPLDKTPASPYDILDVKLYLTQGNPSQINHKTYPFVTHEGRPDIESEFAKMRDAAIAQGETRVAVCVCAPQHLVLLCRKACVKYSSCKVCFDLHTEMFG